MTDIKDIPLWPDSGFRIDPAYSLRRGLSDGTQQELVVLAFEAGDVVLHVDTVASAIDDIGQQIIDLMHTNIGGVRFCREYPAVNIGQLFMMQAESIANGSQMPEPEATQLGRYVELGSHPSKL